MAQQFPCAPYPHTIAWAAMWKVNNKRENLNRTTSPISDTGQPVTNSEQLMSVILGERNRNDNPPKDQVAGKAYQTDEKHSHLLVLVIAWWNRWKTDFRNLCWLRGNGDLKEKSGGFLYSSYCQQIPYKTNHCCPKTHEKSFNPTYTVMLL